MTKWFRMLFAFILTFIFAVLVSTAQVDGGELTDGEEVQIEVDGEDSIEFTYNGSEGEVISVIVSSDNDTDTRLTLFDEDGDEVATDDDSGASLEPALVRIELPEDGEYTIVLEHWNGEELDDEFEVTLFVVEMLDLGEGTQTTVLGGDFQLERMILEVEEDETYFIFVSADDVIVSTLYVDVLEAGDFFANTRVSFAGTDSFAFSFTPNDDGVVTFELDYFSFDNEEVEFTVEVEQQ